MEAIVDQVVLGRFLEDLGNFILCMDKPKAASWNQNDTKSEPKRDQNASKNQCILKNSSSYFALEPLWRHLVDLGAYWILKGPKIDRFRIKAT